MTPPERMRLKVMRMHDKGINPLVVEAIDTLTDMIEDLTNLTNIKINDLTEEVYHDD